LNLAMKTQEQAVHDRHFGPEVGVEIAPTGNGTASLEWSGWPSIVYCRTF
jgi:hypothetical protein